MQKMVFLDTETTGLRVDKGDRIIEIGAIEAIDRVLTGRHFQVYINPQSKISPEAQKIHQISNEFLADKPIFEEIMEEFLEFIQESTLVIHNAAFDLRFINFELNRARRPQLSNKYIDTVILARNEIKDIAKYSLDSLCDYFNIDRSHRNFHGALLDAGLLAEIYLYLTRKQSGLDFNSFSHLQYQKYWKSSKPKVYEYKPKPDDIEAHNKIIAKISKTGPTLW